MATLEIYVSTDIETDGPTPGKHSMLSFGSAAFSHEGQLVSTFTANLKLLPEAAQNPDTMKWWATQREAWAKARENMRDPEAAMPDYVAWLKGLPGKPVFVAYPVAFDFSFMYWYLQNFAAENPFGYSALDIKTYAMAMLKSGYREASKQRMPRRWFKDLPHTHVALDDALEQGYLFCNMLAENRQTTSRMLQQR
jgi:DNA polymerase III alpha subunit (gram-positive type)